jgi:hypothetical protein
MPSIYDEIAKKVDVIDRDPLIDVILLFENLYLNKHNEDVLERFLGMIGLSCGLRNYDELLKEYCPNSVKHKKNHKAAVERFGSYIKKILRL